MRIIKNTNGKKHTIQEVNLHDVIADKQDDDYGYLYEDIPLKNEEFFKCDLLYTLLLPTEILIKSRPSIFFLNVDLDSKDKNISLCCQHFLREKLDAKTIKNLYKDARVSWFLNQTFKGTNDYNADYEDKPTWEDILDQVREYENLAEEESLYALCQLDVEVNDKEREYIFSLLDK